MWIRTPAPNAVLVRWSGVALAGYIGFSAWIAAVAASWLVAMVLLAALLLLLTMLVWQVGVDASGLTAHGALGWPRQHVPAHEVVEASTRHVSPSREFGGWGLRTAVDGTVGVVVRGGEAIVVERSGGRRFVVTVDDAATGAALLNSFAERARVTAVEEGAEQGRDGRPADGTRKA